MLSHICHFTVTLSRIIYYGFRFQLFNVQSVGMRLYGTRLFHSLNRGVSDNLKAV